MLGLGQLGRFPLGGGPFGPATVTTIGWFAPLSEPVRTKNGIRPANQQFLAFDPLPRVSFSWFEPLSEPTRRMPRSHAALAPAFFYHPAPSPFVPTGWFVPLSEPVRKFPRSPAALAPSFFYQPAPSPFAPTGWFVPLAEPVRQKQGLRASQQQAYAGPSRLLPTPTLFGVMSALETKDTFLAGAMSFNRPTDAEIAVINTTPQPAEIGLYQTGPTAGTITVRISIVIG